ncbi:MAG: radical SAM protein [Candidatus Odinarchaeia archaeon]
MSSTPLTTLKNTCKVCGGKSLLVSKHLGVCRECIINYPGKSLELALHAHNIIRRKFNQSMITLEGKTGILCKQCGNNCELYAGEKGICGLIKNVDGVLTRVYGSASKGLLDFYYDPLPTNCVADWVCPAGTGCGYPEYAYKDGPEYGYYNLAVFYRSCNFNCLFCQNWHYRTKKSDLGFISSEELALKVTDKVSCICYFGGDPATQMLHSLKTSELAIKKAQANKKILRVCWETNGNMLKTYLDRALELSFISGGCIKFDLKTYDENLNFALCGVSNKTTLTNFEYASAWFNERLSVPLITASTLLIPGYITPEEVFNIAKFIADLNPHIPYRLLAFYPTFYMSDLPATSRKHASDCYKAAVRAGCKNVEIGNINLLSNITY